MELYLCSIDYPFKIRKLSFTVVVTSVHTHLKVEKSLKMDATLTTSITILSFSFFVTDLLQLLKDRLSFLVVLQLQPSLTFRDRMIK